MNGRDFTNPGAQAYRYGFNGKENDNEVKGAGNQQDYGMRIYDPRIGKFLSVDPVTADYPWNSSYAFAENDVIRNIDLDGLEKVIYTINVDHKNGKVSSTKIQLEKAGKLGSGVAVRLDIHSKTHYFYGLDKKNLVNFTTSQEKNVLEVYHGSSDKKGVLTVGVGYKIETKEEKEKYKLGDKITQKESEKLFSEDLPAYTKKAKNSVGDSWDDLSQDQKNSLVEMGFNKGPAYLKEYTPEIGGYFFFKFYDRHPIDRKPGMLKRRAGQYLIYCEGIYYPFDVIKGKQATTLQKVIDDNKPKDESSDKKP